MKDLTNEQLLKEYRDRIVHAFICLAADHAVLNDAMHKMLDAQDELLQRLSDCKHCRYDGVKDPNCARCGMPKNGDIVIADNITLIKKVETFA